LNLLTHLKIGPRLAASFAVVVALLVATSIVGISKIDAVDASTETILHDRFVKVRLAQSIENEVNRQARALRTSLIAADPQVVHGELAKIEDSMPVIAAALDRLKVDLMFPIEVEGRLAGFLGVGCSPNWTQDETPRMKRLAVGLPRRHAALGDGDQALHERPQLLRLRHRRLDLLVTQQRDGLVAEQGDAVLRDAP